MTKKSVRSLARMSALVEDMIEQGAALDARAAQLESRNANLEAAHVMDRNLLESISSKLARQQQMLDDAIAIAGEMSVLAPVTGELEALAPRHGRESYEVVIPERMEYAPIGNAPPLDFAARVESLRLLIAKVEPDHLRGSVHAYVKFAGGEVGYGISPTALRSMPRDKLIKTVTQELGRALGEQLWKALR